MANLVVAHLNTPPPKPSTNQPNVPEQIDEVIATGMAKNPDQRYATTVALANAAHDAITAPIPRATPDQPTTKEPLSPVTPSTLARDESPQQPHIAFASEATRYRSQQPPTPVGESGSDAAVDYPTGASDLRAWRAPIKVIVGIIVPALLLIGLGVLLILERRPAERGDAASKLWFYRGIACFSTAGLIIAIGLGMLLLKATPRLPEQAAIASLVASLIGVVGFLGTLLVITRNLTWQIVSAPTYLGSAVGLVLGSLALRPIPTDRPNDRKFAIAAIALGAAVLIIYLLSLRGPVPRH